MYGIALHRRVARKVFTGPFTFNCFAQNRRNVSHTFRRTAQVIHIDPDLQMRCGIAASA